MDTPCPMVGHVLSGPASGVVWAVVFALAAATTMSLIRVRQRMSVRSRVTRFAAPS